MKCQNDARLLGYNVRSRIPNAWLFWETFFQKLFAQ
jgi:hypothetical protein